MRQKEVNYKGLIFYSHESINTLELIIDDFNFSNSEVCISSLSIALEYILNSKVEYLIFNKLYCEFEIDSKLRKFIKGLIYYQLKSHGIKKVLFLVTPIAMIEGYANINTKEPYMVAFTEMSDIENWILNQIKVTIVR